MVHLFQLRIGVMKLTVQLLQKRIRVNHFPTGGSHFLHLLVNEEYSHQQKDGKQTDTNQRYLHFLLLPLGFQLVSLIDDGEDLRDFQCTKAGVAERSIFERAFQIVVCTVNVSVFIYKRGEFPQGDVFLDCRF